MKLLRFVLGSILFLSFSGLAVAGELYNELTASQKRMVQSGQQVVVYHDIAGSIWPKATIYQRVEATSEEVAAVLIDYKRQHEYVYRVEQSEEIRQLSSPREMLLHYRMDLPLILRKFFDPNYIMTSEVFDRGHGEYQIKWNLVEAKSIKLLRGEGRFEPLGNGTLMRYSNVLSPKEEHWIYRTTPVLKCLKRGGPKALRTMIERINEEKRSRPQLLREQVAHLRTVLGTD